VPLEVEGEPAVLGPVPLEQFGGGRATFLQYIDLGDNSTNIAALHEAGKEGVFVRHSKPIVLEIEN
jgi:hypothetical protein